MLWGCATRLTDWQASRELEIRAARPWPQLDTTGHFGKPPCWSASAGNLCTSSLQRRSAGDVTSLAARIASVASIGGSWHFWSIGRADATAGRLRRPGDLPAVSGASARKNGSHTLVYTRKIFVVPTGGESRKMGKLATVSAFASVALP